MSKLDGKVALVTGATRGIGKGIALQLAQAGALVYITGRTLKSTNNLGSLEQTAKEIAERGGKCVAVQVNHENDAQIKELFEKIEKEQDGKLDILVNNAYKAVTSIFENSRVKFWEQPPEIWDDVNNVGLRNHYICTVYASRLMVPRKQGLIVNISSFGGSKYLFNVAYGIGKAAVDRMAGDCGLELRKHNVAMLSLMVGAVKTELISEFRDGVTVTINPKSKQVYATYDPVLYQGKDIKKMFESAESTEYAGKCIVALASDKNVMNYSSKTVIAADYAQSKGLRDIDGRFINSFRQINLLLKLLLPESLHFIANLFPSFMKLPKFMLALGTSKY